MKIGKAVGQGCCLSSTFTDTEITLLRRLLEVLETSK